MKPLLESNLEEHPSKIPIDATLVLAAGSRAGLEAPLMVGYYMIGRSSECQVRPKSKSVSRRHCLVHHQGHGVRIFDLGSTSGTRINDEKVTAKTWVDIQDGDLVRVGKIGFYLHAQQSEIQPNCTPSSQTVDSTQQSNRAQTQQSPQGQEQKSIVMGQAWDSFDVAGFLDSEDQADRAERYQKIREKHQQSSDSDVLDGDVLDEDVLVDGSSASGFIVDSNDDFDESQQTIVPERDLSASTQSKSPGKTSSSQQTHRTSASKTPGPSMASRFGSLWATDDPERRKIFLAAVLAVVVLLFAGYTFYQFTAGPPVRVLNEID